MQNLHVKLRLHISGPIFIRVLKIYISENGSGSSFNTSLVLAELILPSVA
jgi:hypothetical protein